MKKIHEIKAVYDADLPRVLEDLGLRDDFDKGKIRCAFSNEVITMENLLGIFSDGQEIKFICDNETARTSLNELNHIAHD